MRIQVRLGAVGAGLRPRGLAARIDPEGQSDGMGGEYVSPDNGTRQEGQVLAVRQQPAPIGSAQLRVVQPSVDEHRGEIRRAILSNARAAASTVVGKRAERTTLGNARRRVEYATVRRRGERATMRRIPAPHTARSTSPHPAKCTRCTCGKITAVDSPGRTVTSLGSKASWMPLAIQGQNSRPSSGLPRRNAASAAAKERAGIPLTEGREEGSRSNSPACWWR